MTERECGQATLTSLPSEIRSLIWAEAIGNERIHMELGFITQAESDFIPWAFCLCDATSGPLQHEKLFRDHITSHIELPPSTHEWLTCDRHYTHPNCSSFHMLLPAADIRSKRHLLFRETLFSLLRINRLFYVEVTRVLYSTNTFSFGSVFGLDRFVVNRTSLQKRLLSKLEFKIHISHKNSVTYTSSFSRLDRVLSESNIEQLTGLGSLHIYFQENKFKNDPALINTDVQEVIKCFRRLSAIHIKNVSVVVGCLIQRRNPNTLSSRQRLELADAVKDAIDGSEVNNKLLTTIA